ncbi:T9SS type A sorting domain-containing protein, partial [bacterium]|nr:T9SS type A sorting domain-containing protein [bacterium]
MLIASASFAQTPGYYKDIFSDGGAYLTSMTYLAAAENLELSVEYLYTSDVDVQNGVMVGDEIDSNGHLLYPDGAPRFRIIYTNGGTATNHGTSLGEIGRERVRTFYGNGGSYSGSCAGAFLASIHYEETGINNAYYHFWPGRTTTTGLLDAYTGHFIPERSQLLNYFDFGGDLYIENVRHNGGCYANEQIDYPAETEVLLRYDNPGWEMHEKASVWAYKPSSLEGAGSGRIVVTGSHPEFIEDGERLDLMQAILLYALDGSGLPRIKAELNNAGTRSMDLFAEDSLPEFTRIGDKQYHHFTLSVPVEASSLTIQLSAEAGFDFNLYANPGDFAFQGSAQFTSSSEGAEHVLEVPVVESGLWYIGVECASTVESFNFIYYGITEVLNGVAYDITATWDTEVVGIAGWSDSPSGYELYPNYPNPFNPTTTISYDLPEVSAVRLTVFDVSGREVTTLEQSQKPPGYYEVHWNGLDQSGNPVSTGVYFCRLQAGS